jgi:hypothetical protein
MTTIKSAEGFDPCSIGTAEADCIAALSAGDRAKYVPILDKLCSFEKFQTRPVLTAAALGYVNREPDKAVELLIKASNVNEANSLLNVSSEELAASAATLSYENFEKKPAGAALAAKAFANYLRIAGNNADSGYEYIAAKVFKASGDEQGAIRLLGKVAKDSSSRARNNARLDLLKMSLEKKAGQKAVLEQVRAMAVSEAGIEKGLRAQAADVYCRSMLETGSSDDAQAVIGVINSGAMGRDESGMYKARAYLKLGKLNEAAGAMLELSDSNLCSTCQIGEEVLSRFVEKLDEHTSMGKEKTGAKAFAELAGRLVTCGGAGAKMIACWAQVWALASGKDEIARIEEKLKSVPDGSVEVLNARARIAMARGNSEMRPGYGRRRRG